MAEKMRIFVSTDDIYKALNDGVLLSDKYTFSHPVKTSGKSIKLSLGRIWLNLLLPSSYPLINEPITKSKLSEILKKIIETETPENASDLMEKINKEAFEMGTYSPNTFEIESLILSDDVKKDKKQFENENITDPIEFDRRVNIISKNIIDNANAKDYRIMNVTNSGAKDVPWNQLMVAHGFVSDIENQIHGPIRTSFNDGQI